MLTTIKGTIDEHGTVKLLEAVTLEKPHHALITILQDVDVEEDTFELSLLSEPSLAEDWNSSEENEAWAHLQKAQ